jgi:dimethylamine corrinoid protein
MVDFEALKIAIAELEEDDVTEILNEVMSDGGSKAQEAMAACQEGMNAVGDYFEKGDYFIGDLIFAGELMTQAVDILKPALVGEGGNSGGRVIICTVAGDLHDIGKNIVKSMLEAGGIEVIDLGIDCAPEIIIEAVKKEDIKVVLLSGVLTLAIDSMKKTIEQFKAEGLREKVKIMVGGAPVNAGTQEITGADAWATNPQVTVKQCQEWLS